jgi:hypothetical protein
MAANSIDVMSEKLLPVNFDPVNENFFSDGPIDKRYQHFFAETGGSDTQVQYNSNGALAGSADLTWDDSAKELGVGGDINLDDGGIYETTVQVVTPTANRTISFPDATGTVALVAGSSGQLIWNSSGAQAGVTGSTVDGSGNVTLTSVSTGLGTAGAPTHSFTGDPNTGIYSPGADQAAISTNGNERVRIDSSGNVGIGSTAPLTTLECRGQFSISNVATSYWVLDRDDSDGRLKLLDSSTSTNERLAVDSSGRLLVGTSSDSGGALFQVNGNRIRIATAKTPASASDTGTAGEICWDADYIYVCTATNTWKRTAIATW